MQPAVFFLFGKDRLKHNALYIACANGPSSGPPGRWNRHWNRWVCFNPKKRKVRTGGKSVDNVPMVTKDLKKNASSLNKNIYIYIHTPFWFSFLLGGRCANRCRQDCAFPLSLGCWRVQVGFFGDRSKVEIPMAPGECYYETGMNTRS